jgi:hypothetical protein
LAQQAIDRAKDTDLLPKAAHIVSFLGKTLVSDMMMAHIQKNNWSNLLIFNGGHKQICSPVAMPLADGLLMRICIRQDHPRRLTSRTKRLWSRILHGLQGGHDEDPLAGVIGAVNIERRIRDVEKRASYFFPVLLENSEQRCAVYCSFAFSSSSRGTVAEL